MKFGKSKEALASYKTSFKLNPNNRNAEYLIEKLKNELPK